MGDKWHPGLICFSLDWEWDWQGLNHLLADTCPGGAESSQAPVAEAQHRLRRPWPKQGAAAAWPYLWLAHDGWLGGSGGVARKGKGLPAG